MVTDIKMKKITVHPDLSLELKSLSVFYLNADELDKMYLLQQIRDLLFEVEGNQDID